MSTVYSMTGYAIARGASDEAPGFSLAIKSVNHRFLDLHMRLPSYCDALEMQLRRLLKETLKRGHIEVTLQVERRSSAQFELNQDLLGAYVDAYSKAAAMYSVENRPDLNTLLRIPGMMTAEATTGLEGNAELDAAVMTEMPGLLERLNAVRAEEGAALATELRASMTRLRSFAEEMAQLREGVRVAQFERLKARLIELAEGIAIPEERLLAEAAILAEKSDVEEEIVRFRTHIDRFVAMVDEGGELGKRLDFLLQELNREANTMLSKTGSAAGDNSLRITELGLEIKAEIEKAREQVQNIE